MEPGSPSITAQKVALLRLSFERVPTAYGDPSADEALARDVAATTSVDGQTVLSDYLAARTAFFDRVVVNALDHGMTQAVSVGAGYDGRALRYAKPGVRWFEIDHPATQQDKRERLDRSASTQKTITFVAADFATDDVAAALAAAGLDTTRAAVFICEGVAVYLERSVLESLMRSIRAVAAPPSRFAISLSMTPEDDGGRRPPSVDAGTGRSGGRAGTRSAHARGGDRGARTDWMAGRDHQPARSARGTGGPVTLLTQPPKTPLWPSTSKMSPVCTWEPFDASYWPISAYSSP